jgi:hypothetical protein
MEGRKGREGKGRDGWMEGREEGRNELRKEGRKERKGGRMKQQWQEEY